MILIPFSSISEDKIHEKFPAPDGVYGGYSDGAATRRQGGKCSCRDAMAVRGYNSDAQNEPNRNESGTEESEIWIKLNTSCEEKDSSDNCKSGVKVKLKF